MRHLCFGLLLVTLAACAHAEEVRPAIQKLLPKETARVFACHRASGPIKIDSKLDDPDWQKAPKQKFISFWAGNKEPLHGANVRMLWDDDYIYFAGDLEDVDLFADETRHDRDSWKNDCFELFIKPAVDNPIYFEFHVTAANITTDIKYPRPGAKPDGESVGWDSHMENAVQLNGTLNQRGDKDQGWTVEVRIPWKDFADAAGSPKPGDQWLFAAGRYDYTLNQKEVNSSTAQLTGCNFHLLEDYDWIKFEK